MTHLVKQTPVFSREEFLTPFDSLFDNVIQKAFPTFGQEFGIEFFGNNSYPKVDVVDHSDKITIEAEIPGLNKDDVSVDVKDNLLTISGRRKGIHENDKNTRYIVKELKRSQFSRSFTLTDKLDAANIEAEFDKGLLTVVVPKLEPAKPVARTVDIK